jgi:nucleoside-diphosphate-sugar epimerase
MLNSEIFFLNKRVLITGASGFIGRHLLHRLRTYGSHIATIHRRKINDFPEDIDQYIIDITDFHAIEECVCTTQPDYIFHLAAYKERNENLQAFSSAIETNLIGSLNLFSAAEQLSFLRSIVTLGTAEEYGNNSPPFNESSRECPVTPYSFSKLCVSHMGELFSHLYNLPITILRPSLAYGPGQGTDMFLPSLVTSLLDNKPFEMTLGEQTRDFIYIDDLVDALIISSLNAKARGQIINIGSGVPIKLTMLVKIIERLVDRHDLVKFGGKSYRKNEIMDYFVDTKKAEDLLGWKAKTSIEYGLQETITYYRGVK